jgi:hypothetical protein
MNELRTQRSEWCPPGLQLVAAKQLPAHGRNRIPWWLLLLLLLLCSSRAGRHGDATLCGWPAAVDLSRAKAVSAASRHELQASRLSVHGEALARAVLGAAAGTGVAAAAAEHAPVAGWWGLCMLPQALSRST